MQASTDKSGVCAVCKSPADLRCTGCKEEFYCNSTHQKDDWSRHKLSCRPWKIEENEELGKHLIATRNLEAGDLIITEAPIIWGPALHSDKRVCVGCGNQNVAVRCPGCSWYACKVSCDGLVDANRHAIECKILAKVRIIPRCDILLPLRMILLKKRYPSRWEALSSLESHEDKRGPGTETYEETQDIIQQLQPILEAFSMSPDVLNKICGLIDVNALETNPPEGSAAIYQNACLLEHSCLANTRHNFVLDNKSRPKIIIRAARPIKKGEHLSTTYTHVLWTTRARREHLLATKYFSCRCKRCQDPTELNSHLGTVRCPCGPGLILPKDPLDLDTKWSCNSCPGVLTSDEVLQLVDRLGEEVENAMSTAKESVLSDLHSKLSVLLHPGHQHCIAVAHSLIQLQSPDNMKKRELCERILQTTSVLDPYGARLALYTAVALREFASCPGEERKLHLERAIDLLKHEPHQSPGDQLKRLIQAEL
ncbi:SET domain-containing protein SmydA-8-like [Chelonus insularis]|uniref:SET domain-containing protein SmydA-8-like n=1 Tax=Chelonus insularis TaxID=460826 RepID=UPI00158977ED|nr:SET domain-containing protein SmydA-8-like [Chelonus insularis]